ncbi:polymorphic toxin MafB class 3, partial [Neisseria meningitidis]
AISLLQIPISHANGLDARLRDDMQAKHYEPGGKYHLFGDGRGSVKNRVYAVQTFDATAVGPILPITHERTGFEGVIGYETHFSGHGHEVHSPFDNHDSRSTSDFSGGVDGGFTVYQLHRTGSEIHPEDGYDGPQGSDYPPPGGARDIYSYYVKGTSTKTKTNIVPQAPFSDRWLKENAGAASGFFSRADEAGKLIWESDPNKNWWANRMDDVRGIVQGAVNPFLMGFQGLGVGAITDSAVNPVTYAAARKTLQGIHNLGNLSPEAQLAAATALQDSAFAVKDGINSAKQWADAHPNITATAQTALSVAEAAGTVWGGKKVELNPTKWDWVKNTDYKTPAARPMQTLDGEMAGGNKPVVKSIRPTTRDELRQALQEQGFRRTGSDAAQYETWKGPDGVKIDIRPNGEVIRTQRVPRTDGVQGKYPQRQDYEGNPLPNNHHHSGYFVK